MDEFTIRCRDLTLTATQRSGDWISSIDGLGGKWFLSIVMSDPLRTPAGKLLWRCSNSGRIDSLALLI
jgi:hypothetical protein